MLINVVNKSKDILEKKRSRENLEESEVIP